MAKGICMVVRLASGQTKRAQQLSMAMNEITAAIRLARTDQSASPQMIKQLLDKYCEAEAELRSLIPRSIRPLA
jgi:urease accessory protein UreF